MMRGGIEMADVLLICIREEDKDDFIVELIKGLMSRGLTVSYAGVFFRERENSYVYDDVTNLLFFASTYFRRAPIISKGFKTWKGFIDSINFEHVEEKIIVYVITERIKMEDLQEDFYDFLKTYWMNMAAELIRNSFEMSFQVFESNYQEFVEIFGLNSKKIEESRERITGSYLMEEDSWGNLYLDKFVKKCIEVRREIENTTPQ